MLNKKYLLIVLVVNLLVLNLVVGYLVYAKLASSRDIQGPPEEELLTQDISTEETEPVAENTCLEECKTYVDEKVESISSPAPQSTPVSSQAPVSKTKTRTTYYVPVPGSGSTLNNDWTDLSGTDYFFDPAEYPGMIEARFETNIKLVNGNGTASVRLFDVTHKIGVINSDAHTTSQTTDNVTSGIIVFWAGRNLYRVQVKSLTADTAVFEGGRIRVITEN